MAQDRSFIEINVLSLCIFMLLLLATASKCNASSFRDGSNTDWFRKSSFRSDRSYVDGTNTDWFTKSSFRPGGPAESDGWSKYVGNRNWFGRSSFNRDVQDLNNIMRRLEKAKQALIEEGEQFDNTIITSDGYNGGDITIDEEHPWRMRINRHYM